MYESLIRHAITKTFDNVVAASQKVQPFIRKNAAGNDNTIRVAYYDVYRKILGLCGRDSASNMFVTHNINNIEAFIRRLINNKFIERLHSYIKRLICKLNLITAVLFGVMRNN